MATDTSFSSAPLGSAQRTADLLAAAQRVTGTTYDNTGKVTSQKAPEVKTIVDTTSGKTYTNKGGGTVIPANALEPVAPIKLPKAPVVTDPGNILSGNNAGLANPAFGLSMGADGKLVYTDPNASKQIQTAPAEGDDILRQYLGMSMANAPTSLADQYEKDYNDPKLVKQRQEVQNYTSSLNSIVARAQADSLSIIGQGKGIPQAILNNQDAEIKRRAAIEALPVQAQLAASQANLQLAEAHLDKLTQLKAEDAKIKFEYKQKLIDAVYEFAREDKKQKLEDKRIKEEREYNDIKDNIKLVNEWSKMALQTGQSDLIGAFAALDVNSDTFGEDFGKLQAQVKDPNVALDLQLKKSQLLTDQAQRANIYSTIADREFQQQKAMSDIQNGILDEKQIKNIENSPQGKTLTSLADLKNKAIAYQTLVNQYGTQLTGTGKTLLESSYADLQIAWKEAAKLGALTGPDLDLLSNAVKPVTGAAGIKTKLFGGGPSGVSQSIDTMINRIDKDASRNYSQLLYKDPTFRQSDYVVSLSEPFLLPYKNQLQQNEMLVRDKQTGEIGAIPSQEFNSSKYDQL